MMRRSGNEAIEVIDMSEAKQIGVLGAGTWGMALARLLYMNLGMY